jgi:hypothetical protein
VYNQVPINLLERTLGYVESVSNLEFLTKGFKANNCGSYGIAGGQDKRQTKLLEAEARRDANMLKTYTRFR